MNIANNGPPGTGPPVTKQYEFGINAFYQYYLYEAGTNRLVADSVTGQRTISAVYWETWKPFETKHEEFVFPAYTAGASYYFRFTGHPINPPGDGGVDITSPTFVAQPFRQMQGSPGDTPDYPTPTPAPPTIPCTLDSHGYCAYAVQYSNGTDCGDPQFGAMFVYLGPNKFSIYNANGFLAQYTQTLSNPDAYCMYQETWTPGEPYQVYGDPNLP